MAPDKQMTASEQRRRTLYPSLALLLMTAAFILTKTGRDALYFQRDGLLDLPWAYLGIAFISVPVAGSALALMRGQGTRRARVVSPLLMAVFQSAFFALAEPGGGWAMTLFFVLIPVAYGVLLSMIWLLGAELLEDLSRAQLGKAYAALGSASMIGGVAGGAAARVLAPYLEPQWLILLGAGGLIASAAVAVAAHHRFPPPVDDSPPPPSTPTGRGVMPPFGELLGTLQHGYVRSLLAVGLTAALVGVFIEFQFYLVAATSGSGGRENSGFFANFYLVLSLAGLFLQLAAMPALQRRIGISGSLLILPLALFSGATVLTLGASALGRIGLRVTEGGLKSSIHRSNWEQAYLGVDRTRRGLVKIMVDGMGVHLAEGIAAGLLLVWLEAVVGERELIGLDISWITYVIVAGALLWAAVTVRLGRRLTPQASADIRAKKLRETVPPPDG